MRVNRTRVTTALVLLLGACAGDPAPASTPGGAANATPSAPEAASGDPSGSGGVLTSELAPGTATMTVDGVAYEFAMDTCRASDDVIVALGNDVDGAQARFELYREGHVFEGTQSNMVRLTTSEHDWRTSTVAVLDQAGEDVPELADTVITELAVGGSVARGAASFHGAETLEDARYFDEELVTTTGTFELHCGA